MNCLHLAVKCGQPLIIRYILEQMQRYTVKYQSYYDSDQVGGTALTYAMQKGWYIGRILLENQTFMHEAIQAI